MTTPSARQRAVHVHDLARDARWLHAELDRHADRRGLAVTDREPARHARVTRVHDRPREDLVERERDPAAVHRSGRPGVPVRELPRRAEPVDVVLLVGPHRHRCPLAVEPAGLLIARELRARSLERGRDAVEGARRVGEGLRIERERVDHGVEQASHRGRERGVLRRARVSERVRSHGIGGHRRKLPGAPKRPWYRADDGVPPDQRPSSLRARRHGRTEDRGPASRRGRHRPRVRQSRHPVARRRGEEARRGGREPAQPPVLVEPRHPEAAPRDRRSLPPPLRRRARPRHAGVLHHRRQRGLLAPHVGAARPGRRRAGAEPVVPDPHLGPALRRRRGSPRAARTRTGLLRQPVGGLGRLVAAAARHRALLPAQPDHRVCRPRLHDPHGRLRTRARRPARARLRVRRSRVRRLHARRRSSRFPARPTSRSSCTRSRSRSRWRDGGWGSCSATPRSSPRSRS